MRRFYPLTVMLALLAGGCAQSPTQPEAGEAPSRYVIQKGDTLYSIAFRYGTDYRRLAELNGIRAPYRIFAGETLTVPGGDKELSTAADGPAPVLLKGQPVDGSVVAEAPEQERAFDYAPKPASKPEPKPVKLEKPEKPEPAREGARASEPTPKPKPVASEKPSKPEVAETSAQNVKSNIAWSWPATGKVIQGFAPASDKKGIDIAGRDGQAILAAAPGDVVYSGSGLTGYGNLVIIKHDESHLSAYGHNKVLLVKQGDKVKQGQKIGEMGQTAKDGSILHFEIRRDGKPVDPLRYLPKQSPS